jgi:hypothetical protein
MTLASSWPADGATAVALDAPLLVRGTAWPMVAGGLASQTLEQWLRVELRAHGQPDAIAGQAEIFQDSVVWRPLAPLAPATVYEWKLQINNPDKAPDGASGDTTRSGSFSTGPSPLAPLSLVGAPVYSLGAHDFPYCPAASVGPCGQCSEESSRSARAVLVQAPRVAGGVAEAGYQVTVWLDNGPQLPPQTVHLSASVAPGESVALELVTEDSAYEPCLHVEASDASGQRVMSAVTCLPLSAGAAGDAGAGGAAGGVAAGASGESAGASSGCHASGPRGRGGAGGLGLIVAIFAAWRRSRPGPTRVTSRRRPPPDRPSP